MAEGKVAACGPTAGLHVSGSILPTTAGGTRRAPCSISSMVGQDAEFGMTVLRSAAGEWRVPRVEVPPGATLSRCASGRAT